MEKIIGWKSGEMIENAINFTFLVNALAVAIIIIKVLMHSLKQQLFCILIDILTLGSKERDKTYLKAEDAPFLRLRNSDISKNAENKSRAPVRTVNGFFIPVINNIVYSYT